MSRAEISAPDVEPPPSGRAVRRTPTALVVAVAVGCAVALALSVARLTAELTRSPTRAEAVAARSAEIAARYRTWPAGRIFPASLPYTLDGARATARRLGIASGTGCASGVDAAMVKALDALGCRAVLRATYLDQSQGLGVTVGVVVLADAARARRAAESLTPHGAVLGVRALTFAGSLAGHFTDKARQTTAIGNDGPYVVAATAGYADGRPRRGHPQPDLITLTRRLASGILTPLTRPVPLTCDDRHFSC
ncbi:hypothetical protein BTM25_34750 [Actinomadura rubteroloni]|uniref:Uncharacterized protein n=1 Tax=Actinomadura rubteroloni TaxID=1926885 RepID=A0A2P4UIF7_9ACTN|nr:hypothetical protein [Actinomadura rubteroloni]POM24837.1 hypothetical protein BTM25_34750 [Actinomadura rubteroloni]